MNTTILNYPGFQGLTKGVKQMLLVSEAHFFDQPAPHYKEQEENGYARRLNWKSLNRDYCRPAAIEITLPCPNAYEGSPVLARWIGRANKGKFCSSAQHAVVAGPDDGLREASLA